MTDKLGIDHLWKRFGYAAKGWLFPTGADGGEVPIGVSGTNGRVLTEDDAADGGMSWQDPAGGGGSLSYQGSWNASTNTPAIPAAAPGNAGYFYIVGTAGTTSIDGIAVWGVGDEIISNGTVWQKIPANAVTSVFGRTGTVIAVAGDYDAKGGLPAGGTQGQRISKVSATDYDGAWVWEPRGIVAEFGDGIAYPPTVGMKSGSRWACAGKLSAIYLDTTDGATCTCELDVLLNGVSIFGAGSTKPFLTAGTTYIDIAFAGSVTRAHTKGDTIVVQVLSYSGVSNGLALTLLTNEDET